MKIFNRMINRLVIKTTPQNKYGLPSEPSAHLQALEKIAPTLTELPEIESAAAESGEWNKLTYHTKEELKRLSLCVTDLYEKNTANAIDIATLKVKAGVWGAIGALIPICVVLGILLIKWLIANYARLGS